MIIYNITTQVSWGVDDAWRVWLNEEYIPQVMSTGLFTHYQLVRLMEIDEDEGATYAIQFYGIDIHSFLEFRNNHLSSLQAKEKLQWGNSVFSFGSLMEVIN